MSRTKRKKGISEKKIREFVSEEKGASKMYHLYGFHEIAGQEKEHSKFFTNLLKKRQLGKRRK